MSNLLKLPSFVLRLHPQIISFLIVSVVTWACLEVLAKLKRWLPSGQAPHSWALLNGKFQGLRSRLPGKEPQNSETLISENPENTKRNLPPRVGPQKCEQKNRIILKWPKNDIFRIFFGLLGPDILFVFRFLGFQGLWALYQAGGIVVQGLFAGLR